MKYFGGILLLLLSSATIILGTPIPQDANLVDDDVNNAANNGAGGIENQLETAAGVALSEAGCGGAIVEGDECEAILAEFQAKIDAVVAAGEEDDEDAAADANNQNNGQNNNGNNNNGNNNNGQNNQNNQNNGQNNQNGNRKNN